MDTIWREIIWQQFGAAIDMLENALVACPDGLWNDRSRGQQFWYLVYHTLFFLDLYPSGAVEGFAPPPPCTLEELDPAALPTERAYTKEELRSYLEHGRRKCRAAIETMTDEQMRRRCGFAWLDICEVELLLYNMRHVQHHAAQLNLILRQAINSAPPWIARAKS